MINWDMAQDENAMGAELAEPIVDIFRTLQRLPINPTTDIGLLGHIQTMNFLVQKLNKGQWLNPVVPSAVQQEPERKGHFVLVQRNEDKSEIWKDEKSGLIWGDKLPKSISQHKAGTACKKLAKIDGKSWRLPTKEEFEEAEVHGIRSALPNMSYEFWSSSLDASYSRYAWSLNGRSGTVNRWDRNGLSSVRCVIP